MTSNTVESPIRIAVIGCGRIAGHHCRSISINSELELTSVCDLDEAKAAAYGVEFNVPYFTSYHEMLRQCQVDVVAVITPSGMHFEHAMDVLETYGKHIIVEKPTFMRLSHLDEVYALAEEKGVKVFPVFQNRYNKAVQRVKKGIERDELGSPRVVSIRVRWCRPQRYYDLSAWRGTFSHDGGALTNQGIHHLDLLRYLFGEVKGVCTKMATLGADIEVEDAAVGVFNFASGAVGTLEVTTSARPDDFEASISIVGSKGLAQIGGIAVNEVQIYTPDPQACAVSSEDFSGCVYGHGHENIYRNLADVILRGGGHLVRQKDCASSLALLHAAYLSDEVVGWVDVGAFGESTRLGRPDDLISDLYRTAKSG